MGHHPKIEMTVIAADEQEARDAVAEYFSMHDEIESWSIAKTLEVATLSADSPFARDYRLRRQGRAFLHFEMSEYDNDVA